MNYVNLNKTIKGLAIILILVLSEINVQAQGIELPMKFLTFRQMSAHFGVSGELFIYNYTVSDIDELETETLNDNYPFALGVSLDLHSPFSRIGLSFEGHFRRELYTINDNNEVDKFDVRTLNFPLLLKYRSGTAEAKNRFIFSVGPSIVIPLPSSVNKESGTDIVDEDFISTALDAVMILGYEYTITEKGEIGSLKNLDKGRIIGFVKLQYRAFDFIDPDFKESVLSNYSSNDEFTFNPLALTFGLKFSFRIN